MNIEVMKTFCDLVDTGSFSRAAEANFLSQSAVSQQLAKLERDLSTQLISRGGGLVDATGAGKAFYRGAREILRRYEQLLGEVKSAADSICGVLRVGTIYSVGFYMLNPYIRKFIAAHPEVNLHVDYTGWNHIYASVVSGEMDIGVVAYPRKHRSIEIVPLASEELVMVCSPTHRLAGRKKLDPAELDGEKFVAFQANIPTRRYIDRALKSERVKVEITTEFDNIELLKRAVEIDAGLSILPKGNVARDVESGRICYARFPRGDKWKRRIGILRRRGKAASPAERIFLSLLRSKSQLT